MFPCKVASIGARVQYGPTSRRLPTKRSKVAAGSVPKMPPPPKEWYLPWWLSDEDTVTLDGGGEQRDQFSLPSLGQKRAKAGWNRKQGTKNRGAAMNGAVARVMKGLYEHVTTVPQPLYIFRKMDTDRSGELDADEFMKALKHMLNVNLSDAHAKILLDAFDKDGSGTISLKEVRRAWRCVSDRLTQRPPGLARQDQP